MIVVVEVRYIGTLRHATEPGRNQRWTADNKIAPPSTRVEQGTKGGSRKEDRLTRCMEEMEGGGGMSCKDCQTPDTLHRQPYGTSN